jgi:hypothetical protein
MLNDVGLDICLESQLLVDLDHGVHVLVLELCVVQAGDSQLGHVSKELFGIGAVGKHSGKRNIMEIVCERERERERERESMNCKKVA